MSSNVSILLKEKRKQLGLTVKDVVFLLHNKGIDISEKTLYGWENGHRQPDADTFVILCDVYKIESILEPKNAPSLPDEALKVARDYNSLDTHGKTMTRLVISEEQKRMDEESKESETPATIIPFTPKKKTTHRGIVTLEVYEEPSAAGTGNYVSDAPASHMEQYPEENVPSHTDFGVIISGRSMEPKYPDQAVVFVKSTQVVEPGEVGIFLVDGQTYIKQLQVEPESGAVSLHSLNPECEDVEVSPYTDFRPLGKVLGGYDPATRKVIRK